MLFTGITASIASAVAAISSFMAIHPIIASAITTLVLGAASALFGGIAIQKSNNKGPLPCCAYADVLQTQTNQNLPLPLLYGTVKLAGNRIWQDRDLSSSVRRIVAFAEGEITEFTDIKINDVPCGEIGGCTYNCYLGTSTQEIDSIVPGVDNAARAETVGSLRNVAYIAISAPLSTTVNSNYTLTSVVRGRKVRVYSSPTEYVVRYSENPAWCLLDFLTAYNGLGLCLNNDGTVNDKAVAEVFDIMSFIEAAAFCDEFIPYTTKDEDGNEVKRSERRFTFNMVFDSQTSARNLLDEIYRCCRGGLFLKNGKLQFKIDKAEPVSKVFTEDDIVKGSETFQTVASEEHYDILKLVYISPEHEWQKVEAFAEIPEYRDGSPIEHSMEAYSVTNFRQAARLAWYYVNSKILQPYFGSFKTDYKAYDIEVGDVIQIDSLLMGLKAYKVKVTSVTDDGAGTYTVNWRTYDERLYTDELGCKEPRVIVSSLSDLYSFPEDVKNFNVVQNGNMFEFIWLPNESSMDTYEIRCGESWESGEIIASRVNSDKYSTKIKSKGTHKFWISAFNGYNCSKVPTLDTVHVSDIPNMNEIVTLDVLSDMTECSFDNTYPYHGTVKLKPCGVLWHSSDDLWGEGDAYYKSSDGKWGAKTFKEGSFVSKVFDIGAVLTNIVNCSYSAEYSDENDDVSVYWSFSDDNEIFSDWTLLNNGSYTFRYCKFKAVFRSYSAKQTILKSLSVSVDVPDKFLTLEAEIPVGGGEITYDFVSPPSIVATVNDSINAYAVVTEKTEKSAWINVYDNSGNLASGRLSVYLKGF